MARSPVAINSTPKWPGGGVAGLVVFLTLGTVAAVAWRGGLAPLAVADWAAVRFTIVQAVLSAFVSVLGGIVVARALARRQFWGRSLLITLLGAPFILPVIVAILGLLAIFGRSGILNQALEGLGLPTVSVYGFHGIILAHVFFNLPLATRLILHGWLSIPAERFRVAASLNAPVFWLLEWPMLRAVVPGVFVAIFLICLTSFAVALTLGGGPAATTIELAIYQALRLNADFAGAAQLAMVQFGLCAVAATLAWFVALPSGFGGGMDRTVTRWDARSGRSRWWDAAIITLAAAYLLLPLGAVIFRGLGGLADLPNSIWMATWRSLAVALVSMVCTVAMALALCLRGGPVSGLAAVLPLAASSLVMGTGLFVMLFPWINPSLLALPITATVNAVLSLPFAMRALSPAVQDIQASYGRLSDLLGLTGWARVRIVILPRLRRPLGFAAGLSAALSMGDLGVIALFAAPDQETLPLAMYRLMGSYRMDAAAGAALILLACSLGLFYLCDRGGRANATT